jgi:hypothetical protein
MRGCLYLLADGARDNLKGVEGAGKNTLLLLGLTLILMLVLYCPLYELVARAFDEADEDEVPRYNYKNNQ